MALKKLLLILWLGEGLKLLDLFSGKPLQIGPSLESTVPLDDPFQRQLQGKHRMPPQETFRLGGVELESVSLVRVRRRILSPCLSNVYRASSVICRLPPALTLQLPP